MNSITKRALAGLAAGATVTGSLIGLTSGTAAAQPDTQPGIVDIVIDVSGEEGFDDNGSDYDLLRSALVATGLAGAVAAADDVTVFAPTDNSFIRLARDLGFDGRDEEGAFGYLADFTGFVSADEPGLLDDVLLYHVAPGAKTVRELRRAGDIETLQGGTVDVVGNRVVDADRNDRDARIRNPKDLEAANGIIQTVNRVLRPIDLEPPAPPAPSTVVDIVVQASGSEGFDRNLRDFDILREAVGAAGLSEALATAESVTVLAPSDYSFLLLALQLGYRGSFDEASVFGFIAEATGYVSPDEPGLLDDVLLYHVLPGATSRAELRNSGEQATLLEGATLDFGRFTISDNDPNAFNPFIVRPNDVQAGNGVVHTIFGVLRPIDL